jgi:hypothetical protein
MEKKRHKKKEKHKKNDVKKETPMQEMAEARIEKKSNKKK